MAGMQTYPARLASFNKAHPATKKRTSEAKGAKSSKWPHKSPTPVQLAKAGFYYHPTTSCLDNTTCFTCQSNLDGWEEDDDPIAEHLKHSPDCGWAITIYMEQSMESGNPTEENPMSEGMLNARMMTFGANWPHENKRGWTCKTQKMVDAGWYYCPTPESDDFVKCAYCNLSLDGWEPKDSPFDEHQRRSPDCMFFSLSSSTKPKSRRPKKSRTSKASRVSTASNSTVISEGQSIADSKDIEGNTSLMSPTGSSKSAKREKGCKKGGKAKKLTAKAKSKPVDTTVEEPAQASSFVEPEDDDFEVKIEQNPKKSAKGKKRNSDEISVNSQKASIEDPGDGNTDPQPPPAKRRATRTRSSVVQSTITPVVIQEHQNDDTHMTDAENVPPTITAAKKGAKGSRKRASSTVRKASATSTASMASLRANTQENEDIDAALEADLERPLTDDENDAEQLEVIHPKTRRLTRTKPGLKNPTASIAPVRRTTRTSVMITSGMPTDDGSFPQSSLVGQDSAVEAVPQPAADAEEAVSIEAVKAKGTRGKNTRKASAKQPNPSVVDIAQENHIINKPAVHEEEIPVKSKQSRSRQPSRQLQQRNTRAPDLTTALRNINLSSSVNNSMLDSFTAKDDSGHETDRSIVSQGHMKCSNKKGSVAATKGKAAKKVPLMSRKIQDITQSSNDDTAPMENPEIATEIGPPGLIEPETTESGLIEEIKPKKKSAKATKAKANKPALKKAEQPKSSSPHGASPTNPSLDHRTSIAQPADTDANSSNLAPSDHEALPSTTRTIAPSPVLPCSARATPKPISPRQSSDAENAPPSSRASELRPPLATSSPPKSQTTRIPLAASTPTTFPSKHDISKLQSSFPWTAVDFENFCSTADVDKDNGASDVSTVVDGVDKGLPTPEKAMTVEQWILFNAKRGEEKLRSHCERLVGKFEGEGVRALKALEGLACVD